MLPKLTPKGDNRYRVCGAVNLWVLTRSWAEDKTVIEVCGVIESIRRSVYLLEGRLGQWVRYSNYYHLLHTPEEFVGLLASAKKRKHHFFNNELGWTNELELDWTEIACTRTEPAPFIFFDELGPHA